jgi:hypothetical protein
MKTAVSTSTGSARTRVSFVISFGTVRKVPIVNRIWADATESQEGSTVYRH